MLYRVHLAMSGIRTRNVIVMIGTDWIGSYKSNYHTITTTTSPNQQEENIQIRPKSFLFFAARKTILFT
jgi:hypothetical protein